jgi:hypothetical protein
MNGFSDPGNFLQISAGLDQVLKTFAHIAKGPGRIAVGSDPEGVLPLDIQNVRNFGKDVGNGLVFHDFTPSLAEGKGGLHRIGWTRIDGFAKSPSVLLGAGLRFNPAPLDNNPALGIQG